MAKNKYEKLADKMKQIIDGIDHHFKKLAQRANWVNICLYEKCLIDGRPLISENALITLVKSHYVGLQYFAPSPKIKEGCLSLPWFGIILNDPAFYNPPIISCQANRWFIPWGVKVIFSDNLQPSLEQRRDETLLYCPGEVTEISEIIDWFEPEDAANSLTYRHLINCVSDHKNNILKHNLSKSIPLFDGLPWDDKKRAAYLKECENKLFNPHQKNSSPRSGRWEQCQGINRHMAARFIRYFAIKFINDVNDKRSGEIASILWICIRFAQDSATNITLKQILELSSKQVDFEDRHLKVGCTKVLISKGLHQLLVLLLGKGTGIRSRLLFENVNIKSLERSLKEASKEILGADIAPILPGSFLISPHPYDNGLRIPAVQRKAMKEALENNQQQVPLRHMSTKIAPILKKTLRYGKS